MSEAQNWKFHIDILQSVFCRAEKLNDALEASVAYEFDSSESLENPTRIEFADGSFLTFEWESLGGVQYFNCQAH